MVGIVDDDGGILYQDKNSIYKEEASDVNPNQIIDNDQDGIHDGIESDYNYTNTKSSETVSEYIDRQFNNTL